MASEHSSTSRADGGGEGNGKEDLAAVEAMPADGAGGSGSHPDESLDEKLKYLNLREDEEEDVILEEDLEELEKDAEFMALARVHTARKFSHGAFYNTMRSAWNLAQQVEFRAIEDNLFSVQIACLADWERVMQEGPWIFRDCPVLLAPYDGWSKTKDVELNTYQVWVRVMGLKEKMRNANIARQLAKRAGDVERVDERSVKGQGGGIRVRITLDVRKPLTRCASLTLRMKKIYFDFEYEKMPRFCGVCGFVGHVAKEHGNGVHDDSAIIYPSTLIAPEFRREDKGWRAGWNGRGGGEGRNEGGKDGAADSAAPRGSMNDDLSSSASSPVKPLETNSQSSGALKRRLDYSEKGKEDQLLLTQGKGEDGLPLTGEAGSIKNENMI